MTRAHYLAILAAFAVYCLLACVVPPMDDELYGWCWAVTPQLSYYDHPPMTAYLIWLTTAVFGETLFAVRLPACLGSAFVFGAILCLTQPKRVAWWLLFTPMFTFGAVLITPDTPLLVFWTAYVLWLVKTHERLSAGRIPTHYWLIGGILFGCGVLGKYTMGLAVPAGFLTFALAGQWRKWIVGYVVHGIIAFTVASPILIYNIPRDFVPLQFQWNHSMGQNELSFKRFGEFMGIQMLLFGTMPLVLFPWVLVHSRKFLANPRLRVCLCMYGFPFAFFLYKAARGPLEGNWALACFVAFWPLAAVWYESVKDRRFWQIAAPASFALPWAVVAILAVHLAYPLPFVPSAADRVTRQTVKYEITKQIRDFLANQPEKLPLYVDTYQWTALLRFQGIDARQIARLDLRQIARVTRESHFTQIPEAITDSEVAWVLWEGTPPAHLTAGFAEPTRLEIFPLMIGNDIVTAFWLWRYEKIAAKR